MCDVGYDNTQSTPNDSNSSIDILPKHNNLVKGAIHSHLITVYPMQGFRPGSLYMMHNQNGNSGLLSMLTT